MSSKVDLEKGIRRFRQAWEKRNWSMSEDLVRSQEIVMWAILNIGNIY